MSDYGLTLNCAVTKENGQYNVGAHYQDSTGIDIDYNDNGDNLYKMMDKAFAKMLNDYSQQNKQIREAEQKQKELEAKKQEEAASADYINYLKAMVEELQRKNHDLEINNKILQRRISDNLLYNIKDKAEPGISYNDLFAELEKLIKFN